MLGEQYPQFTFTSLTISTATVCPTTTPYAIEAKHSLYPGDSFTTQVLLLLLLLLLLMLLWIC